MKTSEEIGLLESASRAIETRIRDRMTDPRFASTPDYVLAMRHALAIVQLEIAELEEA